MTTPSQNQWAQYLEIATQKEIREMAEYAIDHIEKLDELSELKLYVSLAITSAKQA
jgi:hypothetical protein